MTNPPNAPARRGQPRPDRVHHVCHAVQDLTGGPEIHGRPGSGDCETFADGGLGDGAGVFQALIPQLMQCHRVCDF